MLNFLRNLRRNNMNSKYIKYAIGEIILVIIGILIALSINNWNEQRKELKKSLAFHQRINEDLNRMIEESNGLSNRYAGILEAVNVTIAALERGEIQNQAQQEQIDYAMIWFSRSTYQLPNLLTYEEMKSSGDLSLIYDVDLRKELAYLNSSLLAVEKILDRNSYVIEDDFRVFNKYLRSHATTANLEVT